VPQALSYRVPIGHCLVSEISASNADRQTDTSTDNKGHLSLQLRETITKILYHQQGMHQHRTNTPVLIVKDLRLKDEDKDFHRGQRYCSMRQYGEIDINLNPTGRGTMANKPFVTQSLQDDGA